MIALEDLVARRDGLPLYGRDISRSYQECRAYHRVLYEECFERSADVFR